MHIHETLFSIGLVIIVAKLLEGIKVNDIIDPARTYTDQSLTVRAFTEQWLLSEQQDYVVVDRANNHKLAGIVSLSMLRYLPRHEWDTTTLTQTLRHNTPTATTEDYVEDTLQTMTENSITILPVIDPETNPTVRATLVVALRFSTRGCVRPISLPSLRGNTRGCNPRRLRFLIPCDISRIRTHKP